MSADFLYGWSATGEEVHLPHCAALQNVCRACLEEKIRRREWAVEVFDPIETLRSSPLSFPRQRESINGPYR